MNPTLYVFTGSTPREEMFEIAPHDFWTRISHVVEMKHPLELDDENERRSVLGDYFQMFWNVHVGKFFGAIGAKGSSFITEPAARSGVTSYYMGLMSLLLSENLVMLTRETFAAGAAAYAHGGKMSVRNVRSVVQRCVFGLTEMFLHDRDSSSALHGLRSEFARDSGGSWPGWPWFKSVELIIGDGRNDPVLIMARSDDENEGPSDIDKTKVASAIRARFGLTDEAFSFEDFNSFIEKHSSLYRDEVKRRIETVVANSLHKVLLHG